MEWHPKPISWASENKLLEPSSLDRILRQLLVPTLFAGAGGQRRHPSRGWQVQLELQVSGVTSPSYPGHSLQFWSKITAIPFWHFSTAQSHLTVTLMTVSCCCQVPMTETTWMPALQLCADTVLTDLMTASNESLTSVKQAAHSRGHLDANPGVTIGEILPIFRKKSGWPNDDSSWRSGVRVGTDRECRGLERRLLHWGTHHC